MTGLYCSIQVLSFSQVPRIKLQAPFERIQCKYELRQHIECRMNLNADKGKAVCVCLPEFALRVKIDFA